MRRRSDQYTNGKTTPRERPDIAADPTHQPAPSFRHPKAAAFEDTLILEPLTETDCLEIARLRPLTKARGLSLADRACLALARRLEIPVLTADRDWADLNLGVTVQLIR